MFVPLVCAQTKAPGLKQNKVLAREVSPASVVQEYCRLDFGGARLSSQNPNLDKIFALVTWPDEPGWDSAVVVKKYTVVRTVPGHLTSSVTVRYSVLGEMNGVEVVASPKHREFVTFVLSKTGKPWKIKRPVIPPHISVHAAISLLNDLLEIEKDPERRRQIRSGIAVLTRWQHGWDSSR